MRTIVSTCWYWTRAVKFTLSHQYSSIEWEMEAFHVCLSTHLWLSDFHILTLGSENRLHITCCKRTWCSSVSEEEVVFQVELHFIKCQKYHWNIMQWYSPSTTKYMICMYVCCMYIGCYSLLDYKWLAHQSFWLGGESKLRGRRVGAFQVVWGRSCSNRVLHC